MKIPRRIAAGEATAGVSRITRDQTEATPAVTGLAIFLSLAALVASPVTAQEQRTISGAQAFISDATRRGSVKAYWMSASSADNAISVIGVSGSECVTSFILSNYTRITVDWTKVSRVGLTFGGDLTLASENFPKVNGSSDRLALIYGSPAMVTRISAAANFLRQECDSTTINGV